MNGGMQNGIMVDPVSYLLIALQRRFSALEEESHLTAMTEMLAFQRRPGEHINSLLEIDQQLGAAMPPALKPAARQWWVSIREGMRHVDCEISKSQIGRFGCRD